MHPPKPPLPVTRPVPLAETPPAPAGSGVPLGVVGLLMGLAAVLLAAAAAWALSAWLPGAAWGAALAAALGVVAAGVPLGWLMFRLSRDFDHTDGRGEAGATVPAGMTRELFMILAEREFARARRYGTGAALLLVDVDRYARLCEARGPAAGAAVLDALLCQTAPTLRTADVLTHLTGAQMAVFLAHADATGALDVAERIRERSEQMEVTLPGTAPSPVLRITVSAGVAHLRPAHLSLAALIDDAQDAVAAARQAGGNCVRAAPVDTGGSGLPGSWRERRARPKQGGAS
jgi:diguanylate cyclase (GGDEF)-like protein